ncbi:hypothetical protein Gpo141_00002842 [Globisporangium polare]
MTAWSQETIAAVAATTTTAAAAASCYYLLQRGGLERLRGFCARAAMQLVLLGRPSAPRMALSVLQRDSPVGTWVALCGTVFDVTDDPFFDADSGVYALWRGHDITYLLVQMGVALDGADDAAMASYRDQQLPIAQLKLDDESDEDKSSESQRRIALLKEWYVRFSTRYSVVAQITDLYAGRDWDAIREQLLPPAAHFAASGDRSRGKCPMGFGSRALNHVVSRANPNSKDVRTVTFQSKRYEVTNSSLFQEHGEFAHFAGHDITFALATQSSRIDDLDVQPQREYTYAEQVLLEQYRIAFARELALMSEESTASAESSSSTSREQIDLHALVDACDDAGDTGKQAVTTLKEYLTSKERGSIHVDPVCSRTTMTPLHKAVEKKRLDLVELLVDSGANVFAEAALYDFETPLQMAKRFRFDDIAEFLSKRTV